MGHMRVSCPKEVRSLENLCKPRILELGVGVVGLPQSVRGWATKGREILFSGQLGRAVECMKHQLTQVDSPQVAQHVRNRAGKEAGNLKAA